MKPLRGKVGDAVAFIRSELLDEGNDEVTASAVMKAIGWDDPSNFRKRIRQHPDFARAVEEGGIFEIDGRVVVYQRNPFSPHIDEVAAHERDF